MRMLEKVAALRCGLRTTGGRTDLEKSAGRRRSRSAK
jgi:hypothetical protein